MANFEDDEDLKLVKASASLLDELVQNLPKLLRRRSGKVHALVRTKDLDHIVNLVR